MMKILGFVALIFIASCASQPEEFPSQYVSEFKYQNFTCDQLAVKAQQISTRTSELYAYLKGTANADVVQMSVGVFIWPILLFLEGGDGHKANEYGRLKGEADAIEVAAITKECGFEFRSTPPISTYSPQQHATVQSIHCRPVTPVDAARPELKNALAAYYKSYPLQRSQEHDGIAIKLQAIDDVSVVEISGNVMNLDVEYRADKIYQGVATVKVCGSNYNVLSFR